MCTDFSIFCHNENQVCRTLSEFLRHFLAKKSMSDSLQASVGFPTKNSVNYDKFIHFSDSIKKITQIHRFIKDFVKKLVVTSSNI